MARLDIAQRQGHQARAVGLGHRLGALAAQSLQQQADIGQLVGRDEAVLPEQRVVGRQVGEELDHGFSDGKAHAQQVLVQAEVLEDRLHVGIGGQIVAVELLADRRAEQEILRHRQVLVVFLGVERLDQAGIARVLQPAVQGVAGLQDLLGKVGPPGGVDRAAQAEGVDVLVELHLLERMHHAGQQVGGPGRARQLVVDPVGIGIERRVARALGLTPEGLAQDRAWRRRSWRERPADASGRTAGCRAPTAGRGRSPGRYRRCVNPACIRAAGRNPRRRS